VNNKLNKQLTINTLSNYAFLLVHILSSLLITRLIYFNLDKQAYGFWQLLWVVFGYSLLLDFGLGVTVQKYSAEYTVTKDISAFNKLLSTVLVTYSLMAVVILIAALSVVPFIDQIFIFEGQGEASNLSQFKKAFCLFGIGTALIFPSGIFPEVLHGIGRLDIKNIVRILERLLYTLGVYAVFKMGFSLIELTLFSISLNLFINFCMAVVTFKMIPDLKVSYKEFRFSKVKEVASFSTFAYIITFANLVIFKTDHFILGLSLGMTAIAIYHIGSRLANLLFSLSTRFQDSLAPVAAALYKKGDLEGLHALLLNSNKTSAFITTGFFIIFIVLMKPILYFWLKVTDADSGTHEIAMIMLTSIFIRTLFRSASDKFMLMAGKHKPLAYIALFEAALNIGLSFWLIQLWGITGVAWGTLIPNVLISFFIFYPFMCQFGHIKKLTFFKEVYYPTLLTAIPTTLVFWATTHLLFSTSDYNSWAGWTGFANLASCTLIMASCYLSLGFYILFNMDERKEIVTFLGRFFKNKLSLK
jgi:O-antigen/teichoic acid export membrane protein